MPVEAPKHKTTNKDKSGRKLRRPTLCQECQEPHPCHSHRFLPQTTVGPTGPRVFALWSHSHCLSHCPLTCAQDFLWQASSSPTRIIPDEQRQGPLHKALEKVTAMSKKDEHNPGPAASCWVLLDPNQMRTSAFCIQHLRLCEETFGKSPNSLMFSKTVLVRPKPTCSVRRECQFRMTRCSFALGQTWVRYSPPKRSPQTDKSDFRVQS